MIGYIDVMSSLFFININKLAAYSQYIIFWFVFILSLDFGDIFWWYIKKYEKLQIDKGKPPEKTGRKVTGLSLRVGGYGGRTSV